MRVSAIDTIKYLTPDELKRLIAAIDTKRDKAIFLIAYRHGLRATEVGMLRITDFNPTRQELMIHRVKGSISGMHPMEADEVRILKSYLKQRDLDSPVLFPSNRNLPISRIMLHKLMGTYGTKAKLPADRRHFHVLRHTAGVHLYEKTRDIRFVQRWLGHSKIENTVIYTHLSPASLAQQARSAFMQLPRF